jgi:hypothetical protein
MSIPVRDVLVVHPNAGRRASLAAVLPAHRVVAVESKQEATRRMQAAAPTLIIAPPDGARLFLQQVARSAPDAVRVFLCSQSDEAGLEELMRSAAEGHVFSILDDTLSGPELGRTINHLLQHRGSASVALPPSCEVRFRVRGKSLRARCLEMGNFGALLQLPLDTPVTLFPPGTTLEGLCVEDNGQLLLQAAWAHVEQARPVQDCPEPYLRLGVSWGTAMHQPPHAPVVRVEEPTEVGGLLRKALRREPLLWLQPAGDSAMQLRLEGASVQPHEEREVLRGQLAEGINLGVRGDVVHLNFEMGGQSYSGVSSLLDRDAGGTVTVTVPRTLSVRNWRTLPRFKPGASQQRFLISFLSSLTGQRTTRAVLDLSSGGLAFPFDASSEILPAGLLLDAVLLLPDGTEEACQLEIRSIHTLRTSSPQEAGLRPFRAGARFLMLSPRARKVILESFVSSRCPSAINGGHVPFQDIWRLMEESRYRFHPDYPFNDERTDLERLADTHRRLYPPGDLGRSILYHDGTRLRGHLSALRSHSRTWMLQQLCVLPGFHRNQWVSYELSTTLVEVAEAMEDIEFIRYTWRRDNRWPNRFSNWLARVMDGQGLSLVRHYNYMRLPLPAPQRRVPPGLPRVREAGQADRIWLEGYLTGRGEWVRLLGEDLQADRMELEALGERFREHGLHRRRRIFLVDGDAEPLALALSEEGTPGMSLIETTNAFWLIVPDREHPQARQAVRALVERCVEHALERGRPSALGFVEAEDVDVLREAGFEDQGRFSEWIFHRSMIRRWCELWKSVFERLVRESDVDVMAGVED